MMFIVSVYGMTDKILAPTWSEYVPKEDHPNIWILMINMDDYE